MTAGLNGNMLMELSACPHVVDTTTHHFVSQRRLIVMISDYDKAHVQEILNGLGDWYIADLLRLVARADGHNRELLRQVYPEVLEAFDDWYEGGQQMVEASTATPMETDPVYRQHMKDAGRGELLR